MGASGVLAARLRGGRASGRVGRSSQPGTTGTALDVDLLSLSKRLVQGGDRRSDLIDVGGLVRGLAVAAEGLKDSAVDRAHDLGGWSRGDQLDVSGLGREPLHDVPESRAGDARAVGELPVPN